MLARIFIAIIRLSPSLQKGLWKWWYQRLAHRGRDADWAFMNYGFTPKNGGPALVLKEQDKSDRPFIELYNYTASQIPIKGLNVLEIRVVKYSAPVNKLYLLSFVRFVNPS